MDQRRAFTDLKHAFFSVGMFSLIINLLMLTGPIYMLLVYDNILSSGSVSTLVVLSILVFGLFASFGFLEFLRSRILSRVAEGIGANLRGPLMNKTLNHSLIQSPKMGTGPLHDLETLKSFVGSGGPSIFFDLPWAPIYLGVNFFLHPLIGFFSLCAMLFLCALALLNSYLSKPLTAEVRKHQALGRIRAEEGRRNADVLTAMGRRKNFIDHWQGLEEKASQFLLRMSNHSTMFASMSKSSRMFLQSMVLGLGAYLAIKQEVSPGVMIAGSIILGRALAPIDQAIARWPAFLAARKAYGSLKKLLDEPQNLYVRDEDAIQLPAPKGNLEISKLFVGSPGSRDPIIQGVDLKLKAGEVMGVLGLTGSGKSSLAKAIVGIWPALRGEVRIDGVALNQWPEDQFVNMIGYLPQSVQLFEGSFAQNISGFEPEPDDEKIVEAARKAGVHELILGFDDGYQTNVKEGGGLLSGGQRQRVGLARAIYGDPCVIVLDEPNSNLDHFGEQSLVNTITDLKKNGQTVIVVAHRPSAIQAVDKVLYLQEGKQVAFGDRDEVLSKILQPKGPKKPGRKEAPAQSLTMRIEKEL